MVKLRKLIAIDTDLSELDTDSLTLITDLNIAKT